MTKHIARKAVLMIVLALSVGLGLTPGVASAEEPAKKPKVITTTTQFDRPIRFMNIKLVDAPL